MTIEEKDSGPVRPPWDEWTTWDEQGPEAWRESLEALSAWVSWLQEAYRFVELPPCWPDHEGLRIELDAFWSWWLALHAPAKPEHLGAQAGTLVSWHDHLRRAAEVWRERWLHCEHQSVQVDRVGRAREAFHERSASYLEMALRHETEARGSWEPWTPVSVDSPKRREARFRTGRAL